MSEALSYWRRRAFASADRAGLDRDERVEFGEMLLKVDLSSWKDLTVEQLSRLCDALEGHHLVSTLVAQRVPRVKTLMEVFAAENLWSPDLLPQVVHPRVVDGEDDAGGE